MRNFFVLAFILVGLVIIAAWLAYNLFNWVVALGGGFIVAGFLLALPVPAFRPSASTTIPKRPESSMEEPQRKRRSF